MGNRTHAERPGATCTRRGASPWRAMHGHGAAPHAGGAAARRQPALCTGTLQLPARTARSVKLIVDVAGLPQWKILSDRARRPSYVRVAGWLAVTAGAS